ncbi:hypothetical protein AYI70_g2016, partial [Smittium culicis]
MSEEKVVAWSSQDEFNQVIHLLFATSSNINVGDNKASESTAHSAGPFASIMEKMPSGDHAENVLLRKFLGVSVVKMWAARSALPTTVECDLDQCAGEAQAEIASPGIEGKHEGSETIGVGAEDDVRDGDYPVRQSACRQAAALLRLAAKRALEYLYDNYWNFQHISESKHLTKAKSLQFELVELITEFKTNRIEYLKSMPRTRLLFDQSLKQRKKSRNQPDTSDITAGKAKTTNKPSNTRAHKKRKLVAKSGMIFFNDSSSSEDDETVHQEEPIKQQKLPKKKLCPKIYTDPLFKISKLLHRDAVLSVFLPILLSPINNLMGLSHLTTKNNDDDSADKQPDLPPVSPKPAYPEPNNEAVLSYLEKSSFVLDKLDLNIFSPIFSYFYYCFGKNFFNKNFIEFSLKKIIAGYNQISNNKHYTNSALAANNAHSKTNQNAFNFFSNSNSNSIDYLLENDADYVSLINDLTVSIKLTCWISHFVIMALNTNKISDSKKRKIYQDVDIGFILKFCLENPNFFTISILNILSANDSNNQYKFLEPVLYYLNESHHVKQSSLPKTANNALIQQEISDSEPENFDFDKSEPDNPNADNNQISELSEPTANCPQIPSKSPTQTKSLIKSMKSDEAILSSRVNSLTHLNAPNSLISLNDHHTLSQPNASVPDSRNSPNIHQTEDKEDSTLLATDNSSADLEANSASSNNNPQLARTPATAASTKSSRDKLLNNELQVSLTASNLEFANFFNSNNTNVSCHLKQFPHSQWHPCPIGCLPNGMI